MQTEKKKRKVSIRIIVLSIIVVIPFAIHIFNAFTNDSILFKLGAVLFYILALFLGSGIASLVGGFILHYARIFTYWVTGEEDKEKPKELYGDVIPFTYALLPVVFFGTYIGIVSGKIHI